MRLVCALCFFLNLLHLLTSLKLGAFNIRSFGPTKAGNARVMNIIAGIVRRYDVVLIQEVRDTNLEATNTLMAHVNNGISHGYSYIVSDPLGDSTYKERYLFLYRNPIVLKDNYKYDNTNKAFKREPFVVKFSSGNAVKDFVLIPQHTSPTNAMKEVDALYDVVADVRTRWKTNNIVLLGDFNAGCTYIKGSDWQNIRLFTDKTFHWLITDQTDTTVSGSNCPYDRIVVTADMKNRVVQSTAKVYNYMMDLKLIQKDALDVSDHFPVEVELTD